MDRKSTLSIILISLLYLSLRFIYPETIEFGYDQPRLATSVIEFLTKGDYINSQSFSVESPWGNFSWGPALVFFFSLFLAVSKNPITASYLVTIFNLLSILVVILAGWKFFSRRVGLIAGLLLATQPWWIVFSRMIYQPTPIPTFVTLSILFLFMAIKKPKSFWLTLLIFSWGILIQTYLITFSFILTSLFILVFKLRKKIWSKKHLISGVILNLVIFFPSIYFYVKNPEMLWRFFEASGRYRSMFLETLRNFISVASGGGFVWQLGYGYKEFLTGLGDFKFIFPLVLVIILSLIFYGIYIAIRTKNIFAVSLILFLLAPLWAVPLVGVEYIVPRYFLYIIPPLCLILGYSIESLVKKFGKMFLIVPIIIASVWVFIILKYFIFVESYLYPKGFLSHFSDVPYSFLDKTFKWISEDASKKGYKNYLVKPVNQAGIYYLNYVLESRTNIESEGVGHYQIIFTPIQAGMPKDYAQFGPYVVYEVKN